MKRCPECRRDYYDDSLAYCLDDGAVLVDGPTMGDLKAADIPSERATAILDGSTETRTKIFVAGNVRNDLDASRSNSKRYLLVAGIIGVFAIASLGIGSYIYYGRSASVRIGSIAVLPFENRSGTTDSDYLSDGLADSLIYRLSQLPNLKVSPTSSVMRYKGKDADIAQVANDLKVDAIMSGRLMQRGDDLSISVQLIDARSGKLVWAEQYDRKMADLLATQREIAAAITEKLQLKLSGQETGLAKKYTTSNEAYQLYLKGRYHWARRTYPDLLKAVDYFKAAINKDDRFALAYSGVADSYSVMEYYIGSRSNTFFDQAKPFAVRAVELDDQLAEAHTSLAFVNEGTWNWTEAEKEYERAIELNPSYSPAFARYARFEARVPARNVQAFERMKHAVELEPSSLVANDNLSQISLLIGDVDFAVDQARRTTELDENYSFGWIDLAYALIAKGDLKAATDAAEKVVQVTQRSSRSLICLGVVNAALGHKPESLAIAKELEARYATGNSDATDVAAVYSALGNSDLAFMWLDKAFAERSSFLVDVRAEYPFSYIRDDRRFKELLRRMNMPE